jgi:hypothetical protein
LLAYTSNMSSEALVNPNLTNARIQVFLSLKLVSSQL